MNDLQDIRRRLALLRAAKLSPKSIGLSRDAWQAVRAAFATEVGRAKGATVSGQEVFGVPVTIHPGISGNFIAHSAGMEMLER